MSLPHLLLGLLRSPAAGYDLKQQLDAIYSHFWSADLPQIYRTLNRLGRDGLLGATTEASERGPDRRVYRLTPAGTDELRRWLARPPELDTERSGPLAHIAMLAGLEADEAALSVLRTLQTKLEARHAALQSMARSWAANDPDYPDCAHPDDFYLQLTLDAQIHGLAAQVAWAVRSIRRVEDRIRRQATRTGQGPCVNLLSD